MGRDKLAADGAGLGTVEFLADPAEQIGLHLLQRPHSLVQSAVTHQKRCRIDLGCQCVRMAEPEHLAPRLQRFPQEGLGFAAAVLRDIENGEVVKTKAVPDRFESMGFPKG